MRKSIVLLMLGLFLGGMTLAGAAVVRNVDPDGAYALLKQRRDVYLLDVRSPEEYKQFRLADSHLIPIEQLSRRIAELPTNRPILVYCAVGSRSAQVFNFLARRGYPEVYNLDGGIYAWAQRGLPVTR